MNDTPCRPGSDDTVGDGLVIGAGIQAAVLFVLLMFETMRTLSSNRLAIRFFVVQWVILIVLMQYQWRHGRRQMVMGLIVVGCLGSLLAAMCGGAIDLR